MFIKIHKSYRDVVAICDKELIGKIFNEDQVLRSQRMLLATLIVLSWSLLQFATNMSAASKNIRSANYYTRRKC